MALLKIARMGHPVLGRPAAAVPDPTAPEIARLLTDMEETMADAGGVGLAATQVHVPLRVVIFYVPPGRAGAPDAAGGGRGPVPLTRLINPEIEPLGDEQALDWEACLSVPGLTGQVPRYLRIRYRGSAPDGTRIDRIAEGFHARVVQHETDHLDGILYPQRMRDLSTLAFVDEMQRRPLAVDDEWAATDRMEELDMSAPLPDIDRDEIVRATVPHVAFEGWTGKAVRAGLADLELPEEAARLAFPGGVAEIIRHWSAMLDRQMAEAMAAATDATEMLAAPHRIALAVRLRLDACRFDREAVRRAIAYLALPPSQPAALQMTYDTVNAIWYAAGDRSTDFSYYTRRAMLAAVYAATMLFWLDDSSEDNEATWAFLDRRLNEVGSFHRFRRRVTDALSGLASPLAGFRSRRAPAVEVPPAPDPS